MDVHKNARLTPAGREVMVRRVVVGGETAPTVGDAMGVCERTVRKWVNRFRREGLAGLRDRSSRPHRLRHPIPAGTIVRIEVLRRQRWTGTRIASEVGVSRASVSRILRRLGLSRLGALDVSAPVRRYEREHPGELIHLDIKKLGRFSAVGYRITGDHSRRTRGVGWDYLHICIDDASRVAYVDIKPDERQDTAASFLKAAVAYYRELGVRVQRVMTDNGGCYRSRVFRMACAELGLRQIFTRPYTPRTNGKAERFIQTALREWAYVKPYPHSDRRTAELPSWLHRYNWHRPHASLQAKPPISRLNLDRYNLSRLHS